MRGVGSGIFAAEVFASATFTIVGRADTDDIVPFLSQSEGFRVINASTVVSVEGIGEGLFTNEIQTAVNNTFRSAGFGDTITGLGIQFARDPVFATYDLRTSFPETFGEPSFNAGSRFPTTFGSIEWSTVTSLSFEAVIVPEPAAGLGALLAVGLLLVTGRLRQTST